MLAWWRHLRLTSPAIDLNSPRCSKVSPDSNQPSPSSPRRSRRSPPSGTAPTPLSSRGRAPRARPRRFAESCGRSAPRWTGPRTSAVVSPTGPSRPPDDSPSSTVRSNVSAPRWPKQRLGRARWWTNSPRPNPRVWPRPPCWSGPQLSDSVALSRARGPPLEPRPFRWPSTQRARRPVRNAWLGSRECSAPCSSWSRSRTAGPTRSRPHSATRSRRWSSTDRVRLGERSRPFAAPARQAP